MSSWFIRRANIVPRGSSTPPALTETDITTLFTWSNGAYNSTGGNASTSERQDGMDTDNYHKELTPEEVSSGNLTLSCPSKTSSTYIYFVKLFVQGEYGVDVRRVSYLS